MMRPFRSKSKLLSWASLGAAGAFAISGLGPRANADVGDAREATERCAVRLSIALLGTSPSPELAGAAKPQDQADSILKTTEFVERFSRFVNATMNDDPGANSAEDSAYHVAKFVLANNRPWKDLYAGALNVVAGGQQNNPTVTVQEDPNGLGYFRSQPWLVRYAGNELAGLKIVTAYRILHDVVGLTLTATTNAPGADVSAKGREAPACRQCHFDGWYALDKAARILTRVERQGNNVSFTPPPAGSEYLLDTTRVTDDESLVTALVNSEQFQFRTCRLAFQYLYGRAENACESSVFDRCMTDFKAAGDVRAALASVAKDPSFCQ